MALKSIWCLGSRKKEKEKQRKGRDVTRSTSVKENTINDFWQLRRL